MRKLFDLLTSEPTRARDSLLGRHSCARCLLHDDTYSGFAFSGDERQKGIVVHG